MQRNTNQQQREKYELLASKARANHLNKMRASRSYQDALAAFDLIEFKTTYDYRNAADLAHYAANNCYYHNDNMQAAKFYYEGVKYILSLTTLESGLLDEDYRTLIKLYIDMSDAYLQLYNNHLADWAFSNAIHAFKHIQNKTEQEIRVSQVNDNYQSFREHYEMITTNKDHRESDRFKNIQQLLYGKRDDDFLSNGMNSLNVTMDTTMQEEKELHSMLTNMNFSPLPQFTPIPKHQDVSDSEYRYAAKGLMNLSEQHLSENKISATISTLIQAMNAFKQIRFKNESDNAAIEQIKQDIATLKKPQPPKPHQTPLQSVQTPFINQALPLAPQIQSNQTPYITQPSPFITQPQPSHSFFSFQQSASQPPSFQTLQTPPQIQTQFPNATQNNNPFGFAINPPDQPFAPRTSVTGFFGTNTQPAQTFRPFWDQAPPPSSTQEDTNNSNRMELG